MSKADDTKGNAADFAAQAQQMAQQMADQYAKQFTNQMAGQMASQFTDQFNAKMSDWMSGWQNLAGADQANMQSAFDPQNIAENFKMPEMPDFKDAMNLGAFDFSEAAKAAGTMKASSIPMPDPAKMFTAQLTL